MVLGMVRVFDSLYVHVPFCSAKCAYCAFYSETRVDARRVARYLRRLECELSAYGERFGVVRSVFVGGGTPSVLSAGELSHIVEMIRRVAPVHRDAEITVEANPDSLGREKGEALVGVGVNRVSLGVQSFVPELRDTLGRCGSIDGLDGLAIDLQNCGIRNLGVDLIYGIPGQTVESWREDVRRACELGITHLSTYSLTVEEGTRLAGEGVEAVDDDAAVAMWGAAEEVAGEFGLTRYEVSNLAKEGYECRHNQRIWHGGTYLGCGPAAASFDGSRRWTNRASVKAWLRGYQPESDWIGPEARAAEILAFGLRTVAGWGRAQFREATGFEIDELRGPHIAELAERELLAVTADTIRPTRRGLLFADHVAQELI